MASEALSGAGRADQIGSNTSARTRRVVAIALLLLLAAALPFLVSNYRTFQLTLMIAYAIALLGLNILTGYNGQISLGHGAFFAIGSYVAAIMMDRWSLPYWSTLPAAGLVCFVAGFLFGLPALRLEGLYLALATFALAVATPQILKYKGIEEWTGGVQGIAITKPQAPWHLPLSPDQWLYFVALAVAIVMFVVGGRLVRGRVGRALIAIRDNPTAAATMGVNTALYKTLDLRRQRPLYRRCRRPERHRRAVRGAGQFRIPAVDLLSRRHRHWRICLDIGRDLWRLLHRIRPQYRRQHFEIGAVGGLRRVSGRLGLFHADGDCRRRCQHRRPRFPYAVTLEYIFERKQLKKGIRRVTIGCLFSATPPVPGGQRCI